MAVFSAVGILQAHEYTVSILLAGFLCLPAVLGPSGNVLCMLALIFYVVAVVPLLGYSPDKIASLKREAHREMFDTGPPNSGGG